MSTSFEQGRIFGRKEYENEQLKEKLTELLLPPDPKGRSATDPYWPRNEAAPTGG